MCSKNVLLPRGIRNRNPLNIRKTGKNNWLMGSINGDDKEFVVFSDWLMGWRATFKLIVKCILDYDCKMLWQIISRWAPSEENNTSAYMHFVSQWSGIKPQDTIDPQNWFDMCDLVSAMCRYENGSMYDPKHDIVMYDIMKMGFMAVKYHWGYSRLCAIEASWGSSMINYDWEPLKTGIRDDDESHSDAENERKGSSN